MSKQLLDCIDSNLTLLNGEKLLWQESGLALAQASINLFGKACLDELKRQPLQCSSEHWWLMNQASTAESIAGTNVTLATHADIVYQQLHHAITQQKSFNTAPLIICYSEHYSPEQLALLMAVLKNLDIPVTTFIPRPLIALSGIKNPKQDRYAYVSLHLKHITISYWQTSEDANTVSGCKDKNLETINIGLIDWIDKICDQLAQLYIQQHRFNPLSHEKFEQELFNQVMSVLTEKDHQSITVNDKKLTLSHSDLETLIADVLAKTLALVKSKATALPLMFDPSWSQFLTYTDDLGEHIAEADLRRQQKSFIQLQTTANNNSLGNHIEHLDLPQGPQPELSTTQPLSSSSSQHTTEPPAKESQLISHVLINSRLQKLGSKHYQIALDTAGNLALYLADQALSTTQIYLGQLIYDNTTKQRRLSASKALYLNGHALKASSLTAGDALSLTAKDSSLLFLAEESI